MKGYKATELDMTCRYYKFEMNKEFIHDGKLILCRSGFHFCEKLENVFEYYSFSPRYRFFEVEIPDDANIITDESKSVTNKIKFVREIALDEVKELTEGKYHFEIDEYGNKWCNYIDIHVSYNEKGNIHNDHGPAVIHDNLFAYYKNGHLHREDGTAVIKPSYQSYYKNGIMITKEKFAQLTTRKQK